MPIMSSEYRDRLGHWIRVLKQDLYQPLETIRFEGFLTMDYLTPDEALRGSFAPVTEGLQWGRTWEYLWLKASVALPEAAKGEKIVMSLDTGGETTLFVDGKAFGTRRAEWISMPHHYLCDNILTECAKGGERFELLLEAYAGHFFPNEGSVSIGPVIPGSIADPKEEGKRAALGRCTFGVWNEEAYQLLMDVLTLQELLDCLPEDSLRAANVADGLEAFTRCVDFEQDAQARRADYRRARELLSPLLQAHNGSTAPEFFAIGNSHLDLAWLWPMQETQRKTARTFAQQLRLLERYPEYRYLQSQPASYQMCREHYPELYERIREAIRKGQWIADGAMYVEPDTNMSGGESLIRQLIHGKRFYREELGVESEVLWLPDTFGYSAALPQILLGCRVHYLVTQKIFWSYNDGDAFPYHYFTWRGMDGSEVTAFLPTSYTYDTRPGEVVDTWRKRRQKRNLDAFLYPFGYGDGGGGPTRDHIELALRQSDLEGLPKMKMAGPLAFFRRMEQTYGKPAHTWSGELYFACHRGTYTSQALVKRNNRRSEWAMHEAEMWSALAALRGRASYPLADLDRLWKVVLLHQFHDILPGSSIGRVYAEANQAHAALQKEADGIAASAQASLLAPGGLTAFNSLGFDRKAIVTLPDGSEALVTVPALGLCPAEDSGEAVPPASAALTEDGAVMENALIRVRFNALGEIVSLVRKATGREFVRGSMNELRLYKDVPRKFDAWDIDTPFSETPVPIRTPARLSVPRAEGLSAKLQAVRTIGASTLTQTIVLRAHSERLDFETHVDWHEHHRLLKVAFTGTPYAPEAEHEVQFGYLRRPAHRSRAYDRDRFEVCNHRYTALHDASHGFAVLNDCKYGVSAEEHTIALTLLRGPMAPEPFADEGEHDFTYAVYCWEGDFAASGTVQQGLDLNQPVTTLPGHAPAYSLARADEPNILVDTVKAAEDGSGDLILRLYESVGADTAFTLQVNLPVQSAEQTNMLEESGTPLSLSGGRLALHARPFEILTLRVRV